MPNEADEIGATPLPRYTSDSKVPATFHPNCICVRNEAGEIISNRDDCPAMRDFDRTGL